MRHLPPNLLDGKPHVEPKYESYITYSSVIMEQEIIKMSENVSISHLMLNKGSLF
jgi:hypothetical protein